MLPEFNQVVDVSGGVEEVVLHPFIKIDRRCAILVHSAMET